MALELPEGVQTEHVAQRLGEGWLAHDRDQPFSVLAQSVPADAAVGLLEVAVPQREQTGEVAVALAILHEQIDTSTSRGRVRLAGPGPCLAGPGARAVARHPPPLCFASLRAPRKRRLLVALQRYACADDCAQAVFFGGAVKAWDPVETVDVAERERSVSELCCALYEVLGKRASLQEAERAAHAELNEISRRCHR